jgi:hypothetical protein
MQGCDERDAALGAARIIPSAMPRKEEPRPQIGIDHRVHVASSAPSRDPLPPGRRAAWTSVRGGQAQPVRTGQPSEWKDRHRLSSRRRRLRDLARDRRVSLAIDVDQHDRRAFTRQSRAIACRW